MKAYTRVLGFKQKHGAVLKVKASECRYGRQLTDDEKFDWAETLSKIMESGSRYGKKIRLQERK